MMRIHRRSRQRETILRILKNTKSHPTADWIFQRTRKEIPNISLGTVYRNLNTLREEGLIQKLNLESSFDRYDADTSFHYHFTCRKCKKVYDVRPDNERKLCQKVEKKSGFKIEKVRVDFSGLCGMCKE